MLETDLPLANQWREARGVPMLPDEALPPTGVVCESDAGAQLAMAWLYLSNSQLAYVAWPVSAPGLLPSAAHTALRAVIAELVKLAKTLGMKYVISTSSSRGLTRILQEFGLEEAPVKHDFLSMEV